MDSLEHLVRLEEDGRGHRQAEGLGGLCALHCSTAAMAMCLISGMLTCLIFHYFT
jgi:hypothetical protein